MTQRAAVLILVAIAAASYATGAIALRPAAADATPPLVVEITEEGYEPSALTIQPHTTVTWINRGAVTHTVTSDHGGPLASPDLEPRFAYSYTFHSEGAFPYHDERHPGLSGTVAVAIGAAPSPTPPTTASATPAPTPSPQPSPAPTPANDAESGTAASDYTAATSGPSLTDNSSVPTATVAQSHSTGPATDDRQTSPLVAAKTVTVEAGNEWYGGSGFQGGVYEITIQEGNTVKWTIVEGFHNVFECGDNWSGATICQDAAWSSDAALTVGGSYSRTFETAGSFFYLCTIHPQTMRGKVIVEAADGADDPAPTATPDPTANATPPSDDADNPPVASQSPRGDAAVASEAALPNGGGPPPSGGGAPSPLIFAAAAAALASSAFILWRWSLMNKRM